MVSAIAREAGALLIEYFDQNIKIEYKGEADLVTAADRKSETLIRERIRTLWPGHDILGEEEGLRDTGRSDEHFERSRGEKRQCEIPVRNRPSKGAFASCPLDIDVNPLVVAGALSELIDPRLVDRQPIGDAELPANACLKIIEIEFLGFHFCGPISSWKSRSVAGPVVESARATRRVPLRRRRSAR